MNGTYRWQPIEMLGWFLVPSTLGIRMCLNRAAVATLFSMSIHQIPLDALPEIVDPTNRSIFPRWECVDHAFESSSPATKHNQIKISKHFAWNHPTRYTSNDNHWAQANYENWKLKRQKIMTKIHLACWNKKKNKNEKKLFQIPCRRAIDGMGEKKSAVASTIHGIKRRWGCNIFQV